MNETWRQLSRVLMQDMTLRFHYKDFTHVVEHWVEMWEPYQVQSSDLARAKAKLRCGV